MSETREADGIRVWWKEWIKSRIIRKFDGALVGAKSHRDYLIKLGLPAEKIRFGYNVVDNAYFESKTATWRERMSDELGTKNQEPTTKNVSPYFLASNRFIERKNLTRLIDAYAQFSLSQPRTANQPPSPRLRRSREPRTLWNLCLLGDGELKSNLIAQCQGLGLQVAECAPWETKNQEQRTKNKEQGTVYFPAFRQIEELPRFYAHAGCFIHPALEEPWGLVLNEAMACGLPVLSGNNVGAAEELIEPGINGWAFNANDVSEIRIAMQKIMALPAAQRLEMGQASRRLVEERCPTSAFGEGLVDLLTTLSQKEASA